MSRAPQPVRAALLLRVQQLIHDALRNADQENDRWMELDLTMPQLKVLFILHHRESARVSDIAQQLGVVLSTVTGIIDRMVEHGYVVREEDPQDRRVVVSRLTAQGSTLVRSLMESRQAMLVSTLERMDDEDLRALAQGMAGLLGALHAAHEEGPARLVGPNWLEGARLANEQG